MSQDIIEQANETEEEFVLVDVQRPGMGAATIVRRMTSLLVLAIIAVAGVVLSFVWISRVTPYDLKFSKFPTWYFFPWGLSVLLGGLCGGFWEGEPNGDWTSVAFGMVFGTVLGTLLGMLWPFFYWTLLCIGVFVLIRNRWERSDSAAAMAMADAEPSAAEPFDDERMIES